MQVVVYHAEWGKFVKENIPDPPARETEGIKQLNVNQLKHSLLPSLMCRDAFRSAFTGRQAAIAQKAARAALK